MRTVWIYGLVDPREPERVRYVGQTSDPRTRLRRHYDETSHNPAMRQWILDLKSAHQTPTMRLLQQSAADIAGHLENEWIFHFWKDGLLNAKKKPSQFIQRDELASHCSLPLPSETEIRLPLPDPWAVLAGLPDELVLKVVEAERQFQARRSETI